MVCYGHRRAITDRLIELLLQLVHKMGTQAEKRVDEELLTDFKRVTGKTRLLFQMAAVALDQPAEAVQEVIYPVVGVERARQLSISNAIKSSGSCKDRIATIISSWSPPCSTC